MLWGLIQPTLTTCHTLSSHFSASSHTYRIHTSSPAAQALFDQGMLLAYNFNHPEALKSFQEGLKYDPQAPMMHFGIQYALSPYANVVWGPGDAANSFPVVMPNEVVMAKQAAKDGLAAAQAAASLHPGDPQVLAELAYLTAAHDLWRDMRDNADPAWTQALEQYAEALEAIAAEYLSDADAPALAAEARMTLNPWVYWEGPLEKRVPVQPDRVVGPAFVNITAAQARSPGHPLASHLLIHLTEAGTPGSSKYVPRQPGFAALGELGADVLSGSGTPAFPAMGHLTHMPSHIYLRVGRWHDAVVSNKQALAIDEKDAAHCVEPYMPTHNANLLQFSAMMSGELKEAEALAHKMATYPELFGPNNMADGRERSTLAMVQSRYAQWDPLLALTPADLDYSNDGVMIPPGTPEYGNTVYHYVRALAHAAKAAQASDGATRSSHTDQMQSELHALQSAVSALPDDPQTRPGDGIGIYSPGFRRLGQIQLLTAGARAAVLSGDWSSAVNQLQQAIQVDNSFGYTEPPRQQHPIKPCLAWVMLQQGKLQQAESMYREDLADFPLNPWSLKGLQQVYQQQNTAEAKQKLQQVNTDLSESWRHADKDVPLNSSCPTFSD
eukprot:GHUV01010482.1.p1 GENE.GHUV01010482.1~~GHUV01010482.1.p1  ORF type:complete len:611 (+),score=181.63 GHUV01010482.1:1052-2884(+)